MKSKRNQILDMARRLGVLRPRDLEESKLPREYLGRMVATGELTRAGRGLYMAADADITEHYTLAQVCKRVPEGVICLPSALRFHEFTTQLPHQVWMAVRRNQWRPRFKDLSVRFIRYSDAAFSAGVDRKVVDGVPIRVYSAAKTVADCFKFRNTIGLDVAMEALKEALRGRLCTREEIWQFARVCRVQKIIKPYMEMVS